MLPACSVSQRPCPGCAHSCSISSRLAAPCIDTALYSSQGLVESCLPQCIGGRPCAVANRPCMHILTAAYRKVKSYLGGSFSLEQAQDAVQEATGCQNKLHGLQAYSVALGWQVHGCGAHVHGDAVSLLQLQRAVQQRGELCQAIAAWTVSQSKYYVYG